MVNINPHTFWYKKLQAVLLDQIYVVSKGDPCMFMSKTVICVL